MTKRYYGEKCHESSPQNLSRSSRNLSQIKNLNMIIFWEVASDPPN